MQTLGSWRRDERREFFAGVRHAIADARRGSCRHAGAQLDRLEQIAGHFGGSNGRRLNAILNRAWTAADKACARFGPDAARSLRFGGTPLE